MALALMGCATNTALLATCQRAAQLNDDTDRAADEIADLFLAPVGETPEERDARLDRTETLMRSGWDLEEEASRATSECLGIPHRPRHVAGEKPGYTL